MKNLLAEKKLTKTQVVVAIWIVFSILYIAQDLWRNGIAASYRAGQQSGAQIGVANFVGDTMVQAQKCEPFFLTNGQARVDLIGTECLKPAEGAVEEGAQ